MNILAKSVHFILNRWPSVASIWWFELVQLFGPPCICTLYDCACVFYVFSFAVRPIQPYLCWAYRIGRCDGGLSVAHSLLYCVRGVRVDSERSRPSQLWAVVNDNVSGLVLNILAVARHLVDFNGAGKITKAEAGTMSAPLKLRPYGAIQICLLLLFF